jgi:hypothetical protein
MGEPIMHKQIRVVPARSPADLQAFLEVLAAAGINIEAAGGSNVEQGGEFAFAVTDGQEADAIALLRDAGYQPRELDASVESEDGAVFTTCWMTDEPGQLLACVTSVTDANVAAGRVIKDLSIGKSRADGMIPVQIYSEVFRGFRG